MMPLDDLFSTKDDREDSQLEKVVTQNSAEISDFPNHPFKVKQDDDMVKMVESIKKIRCFSSDSCPAERRRRL